VVLVNEPEYAGFCRVIWQAHVREMTDLAPADRLYLMKVVFSVEQAMRVHLQPEKINLASLGNQAPHLHWHVIARFSDDAHFPDPIWAAPKRKGTKREVNGEQLRKSLIHNLKETGLFD
jgi:diadenosine tetraphosphate (Ap4A) HIT family hydrolase